MTNNNNKPSLDTRLKTKTEKFKQKVFFLCASLFLSSLFFVLGRSLRAVPFLMAWAIVFFCWCCLLAPLSIIMTRWLLCVHEIKTMKLRSRVIHSINQRSMCVCISSCFRHENYHLFFVIWKGFNYAVTNLVREIRRKNLLSNFAANCHCRPECFLTSQFTKFDNSVVKSDSEGRRQCDIFLTNPITWWFQSNNSSPNVRFVCGTEPFQNCHFIPRLCFQNWLKARLVVFSPANEWITHIN